MRKNSHVSAGQPALHTANLRQVTQESVLTAIDPARARALIARFRDVPVLVVGDVMLDRFLVGSVSRISPEAPIPIVRFQSEHVRLGGAANVAANIVSLGGRASLVGMIGRDAAAEHVIEQLAAIGVGSNGLIEDPARSTVEKVRIMTERNQQVARVDYECDEQANGEIEREIAGRAALLGSGARALLVSDYLKGTITRRVVEAVRGSAPSNVPLIVDPKVLHFPLYAGATLVTPNRLEAETATHRRIRSAEDARDAAEACRRLAKCEGVLITLSEQGMWLSHGSSNAAIPSRAREIFDVTGAGDTVMATMALALAAGATMPEAVVLANHAAGIVVGKFGPATVSPDELRAML